MDRAVENDNVTDRIETAMMQMKIMDENMVIRAQGKGNERVAVVGFGYYNTDSHAVFGGPFFSFFFFFWAADFSERIRACNNYDGSFLFFLSPFLQYHFNHLPRTFAPQFS